MSLKGKKEIMDRFSEKSLSVLGDYYEYGLIDSRTKQKLYICNPDIQPMFFTYKYKKQGIIPCECY